MQKEIKRTAYKFSKVSIDRTIKFFKKITRVHYFEKSIEKIFYKTSEQYTYNLMTATTCTFFIELRHWSIKRNL